MCGNNINYSFDNLAHMHLLEFFHFIHYRFEKYVKINNLFIYSNYFIFYTLSTYLVVLSF